MAGCTALLLLLFPFPCNHLHFLLLLLLLLLMHHLPQSSRFVSSLFSTRCWSSSWCRCRYLIVFSFFFFFNGASTFKHQTLTALMTIVWYLIPLYPLRHQRDTSTIYSSTSGTIHASGKNCWINDFYSGALHCWRTELYCTVRSFGNWGKNF